MLAGRIERGLSGHAGPPELLGGGIANGDSIVAELRDRGGDLVGGERQRPRVRCGLRQVHLRGSGQLFNRWLLVSRCLLIGRQLLVNGCRRRERWPGGNGLTERSDDDRQFQFDPRHTTDLALRGRTKAAASLAADFCRRRIGVSSTRAIIRGRTSGPSYRRADRCWRRVDRAWRGRGC